MDELEDFLVQMEIATLEESPLHEIPTGSTFPDVVPGPDAEEIPYDRWYDVARATVRRLPLSADR